MTRLSVMTEALSDSAVKVTIRDLGFGEIYKSSEKCGNIKWNCRRRLHGRIDLCNRKETDVPYYLEQNMINIYSLEELNWYILNHTEYLDDSFVSEDLISWIAEELKDRELAGQLKEAVRKKMTLAKKSGF